MVQQRQCASTVSIAAVALLLCVTPTVIQAQQEAEVSVDDSDTIVHSPRTIDDLPPLKSWERVSTVAPDSGPAAVLFSSGYKQDDWTGTEFSVVRRLKIYDTDGLNLGSFIVRIKPSEEITDVRGRTIQPDGSTVSLDPTAHGRTRAAYDSIWGPELIHEYTMPAVQPGSIVEYSYNIATSLGNGLRFNSWYLQNWVYTIESRFTLDMPEEFLPWRSDLENISSSAIPDMEESAGRELVTFRFGEVPALEPEPHMPPASYLFGRLIIDYEWNRSQASQPMIYWSQAGRNQSLRASRFLHDSRGISQVSRELVSRGLATAEKVETIVTWVQSNIRNLALTPAGQGLEDDYIKFEPFQRADEVLEAGYGSPMEITLLSIGLLREAGVEAHLAFAVSRNSGVLRHTFLDISQFDQAFIAVRMPGDRVLYVHPAAPNCPPLGVPWYLQGALCLVTTPRGSTFGRLPVDAAEINRRLCEVDIHLLPDGDAHGVLTCRFEGQENMDWKNALLPLSDLERQRLVYSFLNRHYQNVGIQQLEIVGVEQYDVPLQFIAHVDIPAYGVEDESGMLVHPGRFDRPLPLERISERRRHPVYLQYPFVYQTLVRITIGEGQVVDPPGARSISSDVGSLELSWSVTADRITYSRMHRQKRIFFDPSEAWQLRRFLQQLREADGAQIGRIVSQ